MVNFNDFYETSKEEAEQKKAVLDKLTGSLIEQSYGDLEHYQANTRVQGIINRPIAEIVHDVKNTIFNFLPNEVDGEKVGYMIALMSTNVEIDSEGNPEGAVIRLHQGSEMDLLLPVPDDDENSLLGRNWLVNSSGKLDLNLAGLLSNTSKLLPLGMIHLIALECSSEGIQLIASPSSEDNRKVVPNRAFAWAIHHGWLWEDENLVSSIGDSTPIVDTPSLIKLIDDQRQKYLEALFRAEKVLHTIQENASPGDNKITFYSSTLETSSYYAFNKENETPEIQVQDSFVGNKNAVLEQIIAVLSIPGMEGRLLLENRNGDISICSWRYNKDEFTPVPSNVLEDTMNHRAENFGLQYEPERTKRYPEAFPLPED